MLVCFEGLDFNEKKENRFTAAVKLNRERKCSQPKDFEDFKNE